MSDGSLPVFVEKQPKIAIRDGHVYVSGDTTYVWTPGAFRRFIDHGNRLLRQWDDRRSEVVPFPKPGSK